MTLVCGILYLMWLSFQLFSSQDEINTKSFLLEEESQRENINEESVVTISDFHRTSIHGGKVRWTIAGKKAKIFSKSGVVKLVKSEMVSFRENGGKIVITSESGETKIVEDELQEVRLSTNVKIDMQGDRIIYSDRALYNSEEGKMYALGKVKVESPLYVIESSKLEVDIEKDNLKFFDEVKTVLYTGVKGKRFAEIVELRKFNGSVEK